MSLLKHKNGIYYFHFVNEYGKRNAKSTNKTLKAEAMREIVKPDFITSTKTPQKEKVKIQYIRDLKAEVMQYVSNNLEKTTASLYRNVFDNMIRIFKDKPIRLITPIDIENFKTIRASEITRATVNKDLSTMKAIFNIAIRFEWINKNPVNGVKKYSIPEKNNLAFTDLQMNMILSNIKSEKLRSLVMFAGFTACRLNEVLNLQWKDININERVVYIRNKANFKTKTGKIREIPISEGLHNLLSSMLNLNGKDNVLNFIESDKYIFSNPNGGKYSKSYIGRRFKSVLRALNFEEKYHFHCIRHYSITKLIKSGVNINFVKEIAGHTDIKTTLIYTHIQTEDLKQAVNHIKF